MSTAPHLLLFLSDQHAADVTGFAGHPLVETPHLDDLARDGTVFAHTVTPCPLCVPARVSFLSGHLPSRNAAFTNSAAIPEDHATWLHSLVAAGYETVLCGRMHFVGEDQRHGFLRRIFPDLTPQFWQSGKKFNDDLGDYSGTLDASASTLKAVGGGGLSPVLEYDKGVIDAALRFLDTRTDPRPLCLVVGTYGPHNPYVCSEALYEKYHPKTGLPHQFGPPGSCDNALLRARRVDMTEAQVRGLRAAYYGMVETIDAQVGQVRHAWKSFLDRQSAEGVFTYSSDHGEHIGERNVLGKQTLFAPSVDIPLVIQGRGIPGGGVRRDPASLIDLGPTFCGLAHAVPPPSQDGRALFDPAGSTHRHRVVSEFMENFRQQPVLCRMLSRGDWKLISHAHPEFDDLLFHLPSDPHETRNRAAEEPEVLAELRADIWRDVDAESVCRRHLEKRAHAQILAACGDVMGPPETEVWSACRGRYQLPSLHT